MMVGNCNLTASYFTSLGLAKYLKAYQMSDEKIPLLCLSIGVAYLSLVLHRNTSDRHSCVIQAFAFLSEYYNLRGATPEAVYNMARAFHQLNLVHYAVPLYNKVLEMGDSQNSIVIDAAYNLSLLYRSSGSNDLARQIIMQYITI